jgi:hypothetical protein
MGTRASNQDRFRPSTSFFSNNEIVKLTAVPIAADTAIFTTSALVILHKITVIVPQIVPVRMENG